MNNYYVQGPLKKKTYTQLAGFATVGLGLFSHPAPLITNVVVPECTLCKEGQPIQNVNHTSWFHKHQKPINE